MTAAVIQTPYPKPVPGDNTPPPWPQGPNAPSHAYCPTCRRPIAGWLAGCNQPKCWAADLDYDAAIAARSDT